MEESKIIDQLDAIFTEIRAYYEQMDKIREKIYKLGYIVEDDKEGTKIKKR